MNEDPTIFAYIAGFLDGDGCIGIRVISYKKKKYYYPYVILFNNDLEVLEFIRTVCGGKIYTKKKRHSHENTAYMLVFNQKSIKEVFLKKIAPFLRIKKKHALIIQEMTKLTNNKDNKKLEELKQKILKLNGN